MSKNPPQPLMGSRVRPRTPREPKPVGLVARGRTVLRTSVWIPSGERGVEMGKGILLWLLGIPIPIIILLFLFHVI
jgi:hypothetical protein